MKPTKSDPLKWALGGALLGPGISFVQMKHAWAGEMIIFNIGQIMGGAFGGAFLAGVIALIRNAIVGRE